jgi:hypothetical protein
MYYIHEHLDKSFGTSVYQLALVSKKPAQDNNSAEQQAEQHIVYSSLLGQETYSWDEETSEWYPKPRRLVMLRIKDLNRWLAEHWQHNADSNPSLFDPQYLLHVGQNRESPEGSCLAYHKRNDEQGCTLWDKCKQNNQDRILKEKEDHKLKREKRNRRLKANKKFEEGK